MRVASSTRHRSCTVTVEQNRYGAMTLRSASGRTYQVVGSENPAVAETLAELTVGSEVTVRLARAHGRGSGWHVTAVDAAGSTRQQTDEPTHRSADEPTAAVDRLGASNHRESR